jgi:hypothetical protein
MSNSIWMLAAESKRLQPSGTVQLQYDSGYPQLMVTQNSWTLLSTNTLYSVVTKHFGSHEDADAKEN